jgi:hypothetical protein
MNGGAMQVPNDFLGGIELRINEIQVRHLFDIFDKPVFTLHENVIADIRFVDSIGLREWKDNRFELEILPKDSRVPWGVFHILSAHPTQWLNVSGFSATVSCTLTPEDTNWEWHTGYLNIIQDIAFHFEKMEFNPYFHEMFNEFKQQFHNEILGIIQEAAENYL